MIKSTEPHPFVPASASAREAVATYFESICDDGKSYDAYRRGEEDEHPLVQMVSRIELQAYEMGRSDAQAEGE